MVRKILHLDLDAFFCAVEEQYNPELKGKPFAVGGRPEHRGVVASCSYAARAYGIHSAMPMSQAVRLCPQLIIVSNRRGKYSEVSRQVMNILRDLTPFVEQLSIDEAFLDVSGLPDKASIIARRLQAQINTDLGLPCSLGVAGNKLVAKIANNVGKALAKGPGTPNAITVVVPGTEAEFLAPLPTRELWGVGPKTAERLASLGIKTIGDIAQWPEGDLERRFGKHGADLAQRAKGIDNRPVETERETKSISQEVTFTQDVRDGDKLRSTLLKQADSVGRQTRKQGLLGKTIQIKLRWSDFTTLTRQTTLDVPTDQDRVIAATALGLFDAHWPEGQAVRLIGVGISGFEEESWQLSLFDQPSEADERLQETLDTLRDKFGSKSIQRGSSLQKPGSSYFSDE